MEPWGSSQVSTGISGTSLVAYRELGLFSSFERELGIAIELLYGKKALCHIEGRNLMVFLKLCTKLGAPLELPRGPQGTSRVALGK